MGKFRQYLLEERGLGDLDQRIAAAFRSQKLDTQLGGAYLSSDQTGSEQAPPPGGPTHLPSTDLSLPSIARQGRITILDLKSNPIYVRLSDGTEAYFTYDQFKNIDGKPEVGKVMSVTFQRHPSDASRQNSQIAKAIVLD